MDNGNVVVVKKKSAFWTAVKVLLVVGAVCLVAAKLYQKFVKNKKAACELEAEEEEPMLEEAAVEEAVEEAFEVSADAVIANAEEMEETAE